jgi:hypothetical protein
MACLGEPYPADMKLYWPTGKQNFDAVRFSERVTTEHRKRQHIRVDNMPTFFSRNLEPRTYFNTVKLDCSRPAKPKKNAVIESFNRRLRDELLKRESFDTLLEAKVAVEQWRQGYNTIRPHSALGIPSPGAGGVAALCGRVGYASATAQGWPIRGGIPNLETGIALGGRSVGCLGFVSRLPCFLP